jgi:branched-chain amino acid transport system substrate-binding protein
VTVRFAACCFGLLLALGGCAPTVAPPREPLQPHIADVEPDVPGVRVALLVPLSGPAQSLGEDMLQAAQMALFDVGENEVVLLPRDTGGTPEGAATAARAALRDGANLIVGPLYRAEVPAVTNAARVAHAAATPVAADPIAAAPGLPATVGEPIGPQTREPVKVLAFSNAADVAAPGVYVLGFRPEEQVERVVDFALGQGLRRIAALAPDDAYGRIAVSALREAVVQRGGELGPTRFYPPTSAMPNDIVREVAGVDQRLRRPAAGALGPALPSTSAGALGEPPFDAILLADGGNRLRGVASLLAYYGIDPDHVRFLGSWRWQTDDPEALEDAGLAGGWFAAPSPDGLDAFKRRFAAAFGHEPVPLAALAYDATALAAIVARDLGDPRFSDETLTTAQGFLGASGPFRLRPNGLAEHGLAVLEVGPGGRLRVVSEPPPTFAPEVAVAP